MDQNSPRESRPPINLRIKFRSESVEQFIERYAVDVSRGGIFIRTREPLTVGTQLKLDFQFQNGAALMAGDGTVVWIREFDPNRTSVPPGMGVRFDKLTPESQTVLEQLLLEKGKRERGAVPGSGSSQGGGGMAVRRTSSAFPVLEPSAAAAGGTQESPAPPAQGMDANQPGPMSPLATVTAQLAGALPLSGAGPMAAPGARAEKSDAPAYRPLGTARNPYSSQGLGTSDTNTGPDQVPSSRREEAEESAPFDDINDEPTQIAGRVPSFLASDEEATVVASSSPLAPAKSPSDRDTEDKTGAVEPRRKDVAVAARGPLPGMGKVEPSIAKRAISDATAPKGGNTGDKNAKTEAKNNDKTDAKNDHKNDVISGAAKEPVTPPSGATPTKVAASAPSGFSYQPGATAAVTSATMETAAPRSGDAKPADDKAMSTADIAPKPVEASARAGGEAPSPIFRTATAAQADSERRRSPAALIGLSVVVLGAATIFLFRFFSSQETQTAPRTLTLGAATATGTAEGQAPPPGPTATGQTAPAAPGTAAPEPTVGALPSPAGATPPPNTAPGEQPALAPAAAVPETSPHEPIVRKITGKRKLSRDNTAETEGRLADSRGGENKPGDGKSAEAKSSATAAGATAGAIAAPGSPPKTNEQPATAAESEAPVHQIRITSKPDGADVTLDGQTVGKTPFSGSVADISAPHFIAVRRDGFEPFEQMISSSSAWSKSRSTKGKPPLQVLKIAAKLKPIGGGATSSGASATETKPPTDSPAGTTETAGPKTAAPPPAVKADHPLAPGDEVAAPPAPP